MRIKIYWANKEGYVIHSPTQCFPDDWNGVAPSFTTDGAKLTMKLERVLIKDVQTLAATLRGLKRRHKNLEVLLDPRRAVPFENVRDVIKTCRDSEIEQVKFQAPPVGLEGDDWWWM